MKYPISKPMGNGAACFYAAMGRFFGSRQVAEELGAPLWDEPERKWLLATVGDGDRIAAFGAFKVRGDRGSLHSIYVLPEYRAQGVGGRLFDRLIAALETAGTTIITATATEMSRPEFERHGFTLKGRRGRFYVFERDRRE